MSGIRRVGRVLKSKPTIEGAGVYLNRAFGYYEASLMDPFLLLDDFQIEGPGAFPRGFPMASPPRHRNYNVYAPGQS